MEYEVKKKIELSEGNFVKLTSNIRVNNHDLQKGQILKIEETEKDKIKFMEFYTLNPDFNLTKYGIYTHTLENSPAEQVQFETFLESLVYVDTQELQELEIPMNFWSQDRLLYYIAFLQDQISDLEADDQKTPIVHNDILEIIEFLDNLGDGQKDNLGEECKQHSKVLKKLLTLI